MIEVNDLSFSYGDCPVLKDVSFSARPGEITSIIGANGTGKTTLLKSIAGLYSHEGEVLLDGNNLHGREAAKCMSFTEQSSDCSAELNVFEIVMLGMVHTLGFTVGEVEIDKVNHILSKMGISQFAGRKIGELSGGQRQLAFIAQALVKDPKVLILDEPTSALDLYHQFTLMDFISKVTREIGCVTIVTLHHLDIALNYSDNVVVLNDGSVYSEGNPEEVFTEQMLSDVYHVKSLFYQDDGKRHLVVLKPIMEG